MFRRCTIQDGNLEYNLLSARPCQRDLCGANAEKPVNLRYTIPGYPKYNCTLHKADFNVQSVGEDTAFGHTARIFRSKNSSFCFDSCPMLVKD